MEHQPTSQQCQTCLVLYDSGFTVEGSSADGNETTVAFTNPTADRTITFPNATGTVAMAGDVLPLSGGTMTGNLAMSGANITLGTSGSGSDDRIALGASAHGQIYHDGTNFLIQETGSGNLLIDGTNISFRSAAAENYISCVADGAVSLYHNNAIKMATSASGISVTGNANLSGRILLGTSSVIEDCAVSISYPIASSRGIAVQVDNTGGSDALTFRNPNGTIGTIQMSGSATSYNTSSDYRLKTDVNYDWDATARLKSLKPARFKWIADGADGIAVDGFLAHEAQAVVPEAVTGSKDAKDADNVAVMQGIDQSKIVPLLVKTIQELEARITALEAG